jgi:hypothetical protein
MSGGARRDLEPGGGRRERLILAEEGGRGSRRRSGEGRKETRRRGWWWWRVKAQWHSERAHGECERVIEEERRGAHMGGRQPASHSQRASCPAHTHARTSASAARRLAGRLRPSRVGCCRCVVAVSACARRLPVPAPSRRTGGEDQRPATRTGRRRRGWDGVWFG